MSEQYRRRRCEAYSFRVTPEEKKLIDAKLVKSKLSMTDFVVKSIAGKPIVVVDCGRELLVELKRQGNNLNQILKNFYLSPDQKQLVLSAVDQCKKTYRAIASAIRGDGNASV